MQLQTTLQIKQTAGIDLVAHGTQVIRVPSDFEAREGLKLTKEYTVGKEIGGGVQGRVLALNTADGEKTNKLLKVQACMWCLLALRSLDSTAQVCGTTQYTLRKDVRYSFSVRTLYAATVQ